MAIVALARLFRDIDDVREDERSPYERAVHRELQMLGLGSASGQASASDADDPASVPSLDWKDVGPDRVRSGVHDLQAQVNIDIDLGPGAKPQDVRRLSCDCPKCPAKAL